MSDTPERFEKHISVTTNDVLAVDLLAAETDLSKQQIKTIMLKGAVWVSKGKKTQRLRRAKRRLHATEVVHLYYDRLVLEREPPTPQLIADFGRYSIWNKPYGMLSQGSKWGDHCTITRWAEQTLTPQRNAFVVHRLDRAANGLIMIAHEKQAAAALSALFQNRAIDKRYRISVQGEFPATATSTTPVRIDSEIDGRKAVSYFTRLDYNQELNQSLLDVSIDTGRKHQIRRHSAELGFPVVGDRLYGMVSEQVDLQLQAYYLAFTCPFTKQARRFDLLA